MNSYGLRRGKNPLSLQSVLHLLLLTTPLAAGLLISASSRSYAVTYSAVPLAADGSNTLTDGSVFVSVSYFGDGLGDGDRVINGQSWDAFNTLPAGRHIDPAFGGNAIDNRNTPSAFYGATGTGIKDVTDDIVFGSSLTLGIQDLIPGNNYRIQAISFDAIDFNNANNFNRPTTISSDQDAETLSYSQVTGSELNDVQGVLVTGLFTADATGDINFTFTADAPNDNAILNAFIVHDLTVIEPTFTVNRDTGEVSLTNNTGSNIDILGYKVTSTTGALNPNAWNPVAGRLDAPPAGNGSVDSNDSWTIVTDTADMFGIEFDEGAPGTDGGTITNGTTINFGADSWNKNPVEDVVIQLMLNDGNGTVQAIQADFIGNGNSPFPVAEFDFAGSPGSSLTAGDWAIFRALSTGDLDLGNTTVAERYLNGDLNNDGAKDILDIDIFIDAFDAQNGPGAFAAMLASVPEPSSVALLMAALCGMSVLRRTNRISRGVALLLLVTLVLQVQPVSVLHAQTTMVHQWKFENNYADSSGNNNTGTPNGTPTFVTGRFGQAVSLDEGDDFSFGDGVSIDAPVNGGPGANGLPLLTTDSWTMNIWANLSEMPGELEHLAGFGVSDEYAGADDDGRARAFITFRGDTNSPDNFHYWAANVDFNSGVPYDADSRWHMYTITYDQPNDTVNMFKDGRLVSAGQATGAATLADAIPAIQVGNPSPFLNDSFDGDLDEFSIWNGALSSAQVDDLFFDNTLNGIGAPRLTMEIDRATGEVIIQNLHPNTGIDINSYQLSSVDGELRPNQWDDLAGNTGFDPASSSGAGDGWEQDAASDNRRLIEAFLSGNSTFDFDTEISLGNVFTPGGTEDLNLIYRNSLGDLIQLGSDQIEYVGDAPAFASADFDMDNDVDASDLATWQGAYGANAAGDTDDDTDTDGADFLNWQRQFTGSLPLQASSQTVPEPNSVILASLLFTALVFKRNAVRA